MPNCPRRKPHFSPPTCQISPPTDPIRVIFIWIAGSVKQAFGRHVSNIRDHGVKSYRLVYVWVKSRRGGVQLFFWDTPTPDVVVVFLGGLQFFFWDIPTEFKTYYRNPQLKPSRLAPFLSKLGKRGGLWTFLKVRGTCTRCRPWGDESSQWSRN